MAKVCVQCEKKIGLFKSAIDGVYCSYACREASREDIAENERRSVEVALESKRAEAEAAREAEAAATRAAEEAALKRACPKCGSAWSYSPGTGANGLDQGRCTICGLAVEFRQIEPCPTCKGRSLIVEAQGARCPRCKYRRA